MCSRLTVTRLTRVGGSEDYFVTFLSFISKRTTSYQWVISTISLAYDALLWQQGIVFFLYLEAAGYKTTPNPGEVENGAEQTKGRETEGRSSNHLFHPP